MEILLFNRQGKKPKLFRTKALKDLTPIQSFSVLLAEEKRSALALQIREHCDLEVERYDSLCLTLIQQVVNTCQSLPESSSNFYAHPGGLIDYIFNRTEASLALFKQYLAQQTQALSEEQKLWQYALFSAALLQGMGKLQIDYKIEIFDNNGHFLKQWNPLIESFTTMGSYYSYEFQGPSDNALRARLNLLIARMLMPTSGFNWIASNPRVLAIWLSLLNEDYPTAGTLGAILSRANALTLQRYLNQLVVKSPGLRPQLAPDSILDSGNRAQDLPEIGVAFLQWLNKNLSAGKIIINQAPLLMVPGGLLMTIEIFKLFVRHHPSFKNWQEVQKGFVALGLHQAAVNGDLQSRFEQLHTHKMHKGIVFAHYGAVLPDEAQCCNLHNGEISTISAVELMHQAQYNNNYALKTPFPANTSLHYVAADGQWQATPTSPTFNASLKPGLFHA